MFAYELANHEFGLTYDLSETLDALGMTLSGIKKEPKRTKHKRNTKEAI